ncbi:alpha/beta fold hydrolase [Gordonia sp. NPDC057258]|uniref:alpha/beta fold hydrolase n=1 Tax=unclassified Gordonia (in: high G+C Gram-positive bacteria) TaxID=2657482 RepID=UPI003628021D
MDGTRTIVVDDFPLESGERLSDAHIRFRTYGDLFGAGDVVLLFTYYTGTDADYAPWIGEGRPIDPTHHRVVIVNHLGNGKSVSPSTTPDVVRQTFPRITVGDNARAARLVLDALGVARVQLAAGWSLGGTQALEFAAMFPDDVDSVMALCSAARCSTVNQVFLDSVAAALEADPNFGLGVRPARGLNAFGRVYAGWAYSPAFFTDGIYKDLGYRSAADVLVRWGEDHEAFDAGDLMTCLRMWRDADIGRNRGGLCAGLGRIKARTVLMPCSTDAYFTLAENSVEVQALRHGELRVLESSLGHVAGRPGVRAREQNVVDACLRELLAELKRKNPSSQPTI